MTNWLTEKEAAEKLHRAPRTLRELVKSGAWPIRYTSLNGRNYMYEEKSIEKFLMLKSKIGG
ncbi:MAG TPA: helix-turn-helix domain-containing protein [Flavisolibacter sp.]|nr:helix-turn-helix domain-containing protein [Flavisolibacter sp.]